ncbi:MAG: hypothetical protein DMG93_04220 [Acidobacteria bacterium]|nr:MAG: hypothetical protein DMG93_04220 [Acidobacteriota bacterium]
MLRRLRLIGLIALTSFPSVTIASSSCGSWSGIVSSGDGAPADGAIVELQPISMQTLVPISSTTSADGKFQFLNLAAGEYELSVILINRTYRSQSHINIGNGAGEHLSSGAVSSLPLNSRDFSKLLLLAAGTMTDTNGAANFTQQFAVNGQRGTATVFALDSADTTDPEMGGATFSNFNVDAIQEVQSNSGVMPADVGHGGASYTNVVSKSGTDQIHGSMFEFLRNAAFDARNYFDHPSAISHRRIPPFVRNEFGFTNGGPVVVPGIYNGRGRTHYFGEYQGFRQVLGTTQVLPVPTLAERQGIDTTTYPGDTLMVPVSTAIQSVLDHYPLPNAPSGPYGPRTYEAFSKVSTTTDQFSIRVDHKTSDKSSLLTRFSLNHVTGPVTNPDQTVIDPSFGIQFFDHQRDATVRYSRAFSPYTSSDTALSYIRSTPFFPAINHRQPALGFGDGLFQGYNAPGGSIFGSYSNLYQLREDWTTIHGPHTSKWGAEIRVNRDSTIFGISPNGAYSFGGGTAYSQVLIPSASGTHNIKVGDPLPDSLVGLLTATPYSYNATVPAGFTPTGAKFDEAGVRREAYDFYFEDSWKTNPHLTVNYGLRYEVNSRIHEATKRTSSPRFLNADGSFADYRDHHAQQLFLVDPQPPYNQDWSGLGPRLAIDYTISSDTVLHAGGAITTLLPNLWQDNFLTAGTPFTFAPNFAAQPNVPVPFSNVAVSFALPPPYATNGQLVFPDGTSTSVRPNTILDVDRWTSDITALTPGNQVQLPSVSGIDRNFSNGYLGTFTAGIDREFRDVKLSAVYVGTVGMHLPRVYAPNGYVGAEPEFAPFTRFDSSGHPVGGYSTESLITSGSHSSYHALQTSLAKNSPRAGLGFQASYTYSKSLDDTSAVLGGLLGTAGVVLQTQPQNPWDPGAEKAPSTFDVTHVFSASVIQLLYLDRMHFLRALPKVTTLGWQFLNITTLTSGSPFTIFSGIQQTGVGGGGGTDRPDLLIQPHLSTSRRVREDYFGQGTSNASFFLVPINVPGGSGPKHGRFGTLGRNSFRGPAFHDFDVALIKDTPVGHRGNAELAIIEFRAELVFPKTDLLNSHERGSRLSRG